MSAGLPFEEPLAKELPEHVRRSGQFWPEKIGKAFQQISKANWRCPSTKMLFCTPGFKSSFDRSTEGVLGGKVVHKILSKLRH